MRSTSAPDSIRHSRQRQNWWLLAWALPLCAAALLAWLWWPTPAVPVPVAGAASAGEKLPSQIERGRYLATQGNCVGCHSLPGQAPFAGGTPVSTPFGTLYGPNLTPSPQGLAGWTASDFWRALHHGQAPDGRLLSPAFPYTNTTHIGREDSDALFAFLQSLPPDATANRPHDLRWPYNTQAAIKAWRALYFTPAPQQTQPAAGQDELARGRYLVQGLGHCSACHSPRNAWGGLRDGAELSGGHMASGWYAPSLLDPQEAGVQGWPVPAVVALLRDGRSGHHAANGPMATLVAQSLRHWQEADLQAVARYLTTLPVQTVPRPPADGDRNATHLAQGKRLYEQHCASCHGDQGQGWSLADGQVAYPPLAGHRAVNMASPANLVHMVQEGGFGLPSAQHAQPFGMPPFQQVLDDQAMAALLTYIRQAWGNQGAAVQVLDVHQLGNSGGR